MQSNELAPLDDEHGALDVATPDGGDMGGGGASDFAGELSGASGGGRNINTTAVVLGIILAAAAGGLWSMRWVSNANAGMMVESPAEIQVRQLLPGIISAPEDLNEDAGSQLAIIGPDRNALQVPEGDVQKNPFIIDGVDDEVTEVLEPTEVVPEIDPREERRRMIEAAGNRIFVKSLLRGGTPVAIANDETLRVGDILVVDDFEFTVESIGNRVMFVYDDPLLDEPVRVARAQGEEVERAPTRPSSNRRGGRRGR